MKDETRATIFKIPSENKSVENEQEGTLAPVAMQMKHDLSEKCHSDGAEICVNVVPDHKNALRRFENGSRLPIETKKLKETFHAESGNYLQRNRTHNRA